MTTVAVRERPILFSGEMVRAILDGRKTQTRRVLTPQPDGSLDYHRGNVRKFVDLGVEVPSHRAVFGARREDGDPIMAFRDGRDSVKDDIPCPFGAVGDRLWVREAFTLCDARDEEDEGYVPVLYRADPVFDGMQASDFAWRWSPSIHMPRWASRLTLEITGIRVERVQDISEADVRAEGCEWLSYRCAREMRPEDPTEYSDLWDMLNSRRGYGWDVNPWVWVVEFRKVAS